MTVFSCSLYPAFSQSGIKVELIKSDEVKNGVVAPQFDGGEEALYNYLTDKIRYPLLLVDIEMEGDVYVKANIGQKGNVGDVEIVRGFDPLADDRVVSAVKRMPRWIPATMNGEVIDMPIELKVVFTLNDSLRNYVIEQKKNGVSLEDLDKSSQEILEKESLGKDEDNKSKQDTLENRLPEFPGGKVALDAYLKENLKYPKKAIQMKVEGRAVFNITVSAEGEITNIVLYKGLYYECNEEAYFLIKRMPKWTPGLKDGKPAAMEVLLPIPFVLPR